MGSEMCIRDSSIDEDGALWDYNQFEVRIAMATIKNSQQTILVADQHKFGRRAMHRMGHISDFDVVVTDERLDDELNDLLTSSGVNFESSEH